MYLKAPILKLQTYRVSPSKTSFCEGDFKAFLWPIDGATSSAPPYFRPAIGANGSPIRSPLLNKLLKLKINIRFDQLTTP